ncbi:MAG TPA: recombinase family protein [Solirubrobacteraceae bacterium]|nr:recombinase family protein [Solirubrobacteraceae bacterium]
MRKVEVGGKPGKAPLGYLNVREPLPHGGEARTIAIDEPRAEIITWAFEAYATGVYSLIDMVTLLEVRGLRTRGSARYTPRSLGLSAVHSLLSNPFYAGKVRYKGKIYAGRYKALVDEELFETVQAVLKAHNKSGERDRKHQHYLKGTIRCGYCDYRLTYSLNKGKGGAYPYFICGPSQRRECTCGYLRVESVEAKIEEHYKTIKLEPHNRDGVIRQIEARLATLADTSKGEISRCDTLLAGLKEEERKLLQKHYKDEISDELFAEEAARITRTRQRQGHHGSPKRQLRRTQQVHGARAASRQLRPPRPLPPRHDPYPTPNEPSNLRGHLGRTRRGPRDRHPIQDRQSARGGLGTPGSNRAHQQPMRRREHSRT